MKTHKILVLILICTIYNPTPLAAAPSYGTIMPKNGQWSAGAETNLTFGHKIESYQNVKSLQCFYNLSYGFADWFSFDVKLGAGDITTKPYATNNVHFDTNFAGGYGWRAKIFEDKKNDVKAMWGFQHISVHPSRKKISGVKHDIIWDDWQLQTSITKRVGNLHPYCGFKGSVLYIIRRVDNDKTRRHSHKWLGLIVGTDVRLNDYFFFNIESRFFDETALNTGFTITY